MSSFSDTEEDILANDIYKQNKVEIIRQLYKMVMKDDTIRKEITRLKKNDDPMKKPEYFEKLFKKILKQIIPQLKEEILQEVRKDTKKEIKAFLTAFKRRTNYI